MVTYYSVCHVDTATLHLLGTEESSWAKNWYDNLMKEIVSDSLVSFSSIAEYLNGQKSMFDVLMKWYSTDATTPIIPPAPYATYLLSPDAMGGIPDDSFADDFIKHIHKLWCQDFQAVDAIPQFLPGWEISKGACFDHTWWLGEDGDFSQFFSVDDEAAEYFQVCTDVVTIKCHV